MPVAPRLTHVPSYFHMPMEQSQDSVLGRLLKALVTRLLLFSWNCQGLTTDNLLISLGRRKDEQNPEAVKEGCDLCPGRPSKLFVPHWGASYPPAQPQQVRQRMPSSGLLPELSPCWRKCSSQPLQSWCSGACCNWKGSESPVLHRRQPALAEQCCWCCNRIRASSPCHRAG